MYAISAGHLAGSLALFSVVQNDEDFTLLEQTLMILGVTNVRYDRPLNNFSR